jgi:hypothetical protein
LAKISLAGFRFPAPVEGGQVNFCKDIHCSAFGVPETPHLVKRAPGAVPEPGDYTRHGISGGVVMKCVMYGLTVRILHRYDNVNP